MAVLIIVLKTIVAVLSVLLSLLILLHKGKGGGLSDMFGGGLTANAGTSGVAERNLNRWTVGIAILWVLLIVSTGDLMLIAIICLFTGFTLGFFTAALCQAASHSDSDRKNNR